MDTFIIWIFLGFFALEFIIGFILDGLNQREIKAHTKVPSFFGNVFTQNDFLNSQSYTLSKIRFGKWERLYTAILTLGILFSGLLPWLQKSLEPHIENQLFLGTFFVFILLGLSALIKLPLNLYQTFYLEGKFGFNQTKPKTYILDLVKNLLLSLVLGAPILMGILSFIYRGGELWWLWGFLFVATFQLIIMVLYPVLLAPLFNKFNPLPEGSLKTELKSLADKINFPNQDIYIMNGSLRSSHSNAYFTGFGKLRRIVLYDTLVSQMTTEELKGVLCHEMGHYKKGHVYTMLGTQFIMQFAVFWFFSLALDWRPLYTAFGFTENPEALPHVGLFLLTTVFSTFTFFLGPILNYRSRKHEFEADAFAVENTREKNALESALLKLAKKNLSNLTPHPWYSAFHYTHPTLYERISALRKKVQNAAT